jgi:hypothetical protein
MLAFCRVRFPGLGNDTAETSEWSESGSLPLKEIHHRALLHLLAIYWEENHGTLHTLPRRLLTG